MARTPRTPHLVAAEFSPDAKKYIQRELAAWFASAARDLPWRQTRDPYAVLVSELMLQQTQVATVIPYFTRWLKRFPDFDTLAAADEAEVLASWQGLGYYSRARNLHRAAKHIVTHHSGNMPCDIAKIRALPGVGRYTAGALASFAFDLPEPLIDANVARVLARILGLHTPIDSSAGQKALWEAATALVPQIGARTFNSALMELGALLCTPRNAQCLLCPIRNQCRAFVAGTVSVLPQKKPRRSTVALAEHSAWFVKEGRILLEQQQGKRWSGLWKLPTLPEAPPGKPIYQADYPFTHHRVTLSIFAAHAEPPMQENHAWHPVDALSEVALAAPHRRAIEMLLSRYS